MSPASPTGTAPPLEASIARQGFVQGNAAFAAGLAGVSQVEHWDAGAQIFGQGDAGQELFLILAGGVDVVVNGRTVATLGAAQHFGEMSVIDPAARRSAAVLATQSTWTARVSESRFTELAQAFPFAWRALAAELAERLRQVNGQVS